MDVGPPPPLLQTLVLAHPEAIRQAERGGGFGRLPLHIAARSRAGRDAIECLLTYHPQAAGTPDQLRRLPLHYALKNGSDPGVVGLLLEASPGAVRAADHRGWLPLHVACSSGTPPEVMGWLLEDHPELVLERTGRGSDCLKCARMSRGHPNEEEVVRFLQGRMDALAGGGGGGDHAEEEERGAGSKHAATGDKNAPSGDAASAFAAETLLRLRPLPRRRRSSGVPQSRLGCPPCSRGERHSARTAAATRMQGWRTCELEGDGAAGVA